MRDTGPISARAERAGARYVTFMTTMNGVYDSATNDPRNFSEAGVARLKKDLVSIGREHLEIQADYLWQDLEWALSESVADASRDLGGGLPPSDPVETLQHALSASYDYSASEMNSQITRDIAQVVNRFQNFRMRLHMANPASIDIETLISLKMTERREKLFFRDRGGRRWPSQKFVRVLWRKTLRDLYVRAYLFELARAGIESVFVWHPDPSHRAYGMEMFMSRDDGPTFDDLFDDVFHPNANALPRLQLEEAFAA